MSRDGTIVAEHLWKRFRADRRKRTLRDRLPSRHHDVPLDKYRWVLRDIDLHIEPGDAVGLVGANGSGKSTLLKIFTEIMYPYAGHLEVEGRVGALLEVRAGLHHMLTGRENIYLYGTLLGFTRARITERFDEIVEFANVEEAIDRQIKYYSSGMQMRLGFSVAAFLEPDIMLVDEALAVGDAFFQQRCLERIRDLLAGGTTLVLVSHDLAAVESVCDRTIWLRDGEVAGDGATQDVLAQYRQWIESKSQFGYDHGGSIQIPVARVRATDSGMIQSQTSVGIGLRLDTPEELTGSICLGVSQGTAAPVFLVNEKLELKPGTNEFECTIPNLPLAAGRYFVWLEIVDANGDIAVRWHPVCSFRVHGAELIAAPVGVMRLAPVHVDSSWRSSHVRGGLIDDTPVGGS
jgi:ABC-type polysaccharide/polyol phosphate transport system ATPase subunit